ncbi:retrotransposon protein, putative, Ty1-copia subclass [Cucumis melo var. makuwa]|uniref:Retrotransposon protein, putative, Ty1-copia subclass n=1 Tax=Cucumis melo var. makuwa TaxID=1194695 RepID=A0A5A7T035_CUCMM|nr:retrotransposon protein, putative, Ty1-copia subclass [Cucumis melo var. makuwa]
MPQRSGKIVSQPNPYLDLTKIEVVIPDDGVEDSLSYKQAMNDVDKNQWVKAMDLEMKLMHEVYLSKECPKTPQEVEDMRRIPYASTVGSLMYAMVSTRLDICYVVEIVSKYQSNLGMKQGCIADSTMEAEYVAACEATKEAILFRKFLHDLEVVPNMNLPITLYYDNDVIITKIASEHNIADSFTKTLTTKVFEGHLESLGLRDMYIRCEWPDCRLNMLIILGTRSSGELGT